jgi:hypothetical protein
VGKSKSMATLTAAGILFVHFRLHWRWQKHNVPVFSSLLRFQRKQRVDCYDFVFAVVVVFAVDNCQGWTCEVSGVGDTEFSLGKKHCTLCISYCFSTYLWYGE